MIKVQCENCLPKEGIEVPVFTQSDKQKLTELKINKRLQTVKVLMDEYKLTHRDAKYIAIHISEKHGICNRCDFDKLDTEYLNCPKCGALNFNWKI